METREGQDREGQDREGRKQKQQATECIQRGQRHHSQAIEARKLGQKDLASRDFDRAIENFSEVIRLDPEHANAYLLRARVYEEMGEDDKAEVDLTSARQLESK